MTSVIAPAFFCVFLNAANRKARWLPCSCFQKPPPLPIPFSNDTNISHMDKWVKYGSPENHNNFFKNACIFVSNFVEYR